MSIYNIINSILFKKPIERCAIEELHVPYMFIKWFSFYDPSVVPLANELNKLGHQFEDKQVSYDFFNTVVPKVKFKRIQYIKKPKKGTKKKAEKDREEKIARLADSHELSQREAEMYLDLLEQLD
jgi:hypothetical protein